MTGDKKNDNYNSIATNVKQSMLEEATETGSIQCRILVYNTCCKRERKRKDCEFVQTLLTRSLCNCAKYLTANKVSQILAICIHWLTVFHYL